MHEFQNETDGYGFQIETTGEGCIVVDEYLGQAGQEIAEADILQLLDGIDHNFK